MNKIKKTALAGATAGAMLLNTLMPAFAATTIEISGNANNDNEVKLESTKETAVEQTNNAHVENNITAKSNTGKNDANRNAGGEVQIHTGDSAVDVGVQNDLNSNVAEVDRCGSCGVGDATIKVTDNTNHDNDVDFKTKNTTVLDQENRAKVENNVTSKANSGLNDANRNAGGDVHIDTGHAHTETHINNTLNSNDAIIGGGEGNGGGIHAEISGNTNNDNDLKIKAESATGLAQENSARVYNNVTSKSNSGKNDARRNAGGDIDIYTGDAHTHTDIYNTLNGNSAMIAGGGEGDGVSARITGNANIGDNDLELDLLAETLVAQENRGHVENNVTAEGNTGENTARRNAGGMVVIDTGDSDVMVHLDTMANFNFADVDCDCLFDSVLAKIAGNTNEDNKIKANLDDTLYVTQENCGKPDRMTSRLMRKHHCGTFNNVDAEGVTGVNDANRNASGDEDPAITTGDGYVNVDAVNTGNTNMYGDGASFDWPFPTGDGEGVNVNVSLNLSDLIAWLLG